MIDYADYYTLHVLNDIKSSRNYQELLWIARDILEAMNEDWAPRPIIQICGPISTGGKGSRPENLVVFSRAIDRACADGFIVFNQMPFEDAMLRIYNSSPDMQGTRLLEEFYDPIFRSGLIDFLGFLSNWGGSNGAHWEHKRAKELNIPILYLSDYYIID